ncbi:MAG TPA: tetratricopeptide repeat protein [Phycisphaerae bacterium]|nr:tetratricopeptide repeat protein [Phycisphaerae bacterium]
MLADCLLAEGNILEAKATYRQASQTRPKRAGIWASLAKVALMGNDLTLAMQGARRARKLDANHLDAAILLGYALLRKGEQKLACEVLRSAWNNHPDNTMLLSLLGRGYAETGREDEARECYALALRLEPQNKVAGELLVRLDNKIAARTVGEHPRSR